MHRQIGAAPSQVSYIHYKIHAPCFVQASRTLLMQLARFRLPYGTREVLLSAATFLS